MDEFQDHLLDLLEAELKELRNDAYTCCSCTSCGLCLQALEPIYYFINTSTRTDSCDCDNNSGCKICCYKTRTGDFADSSGSSFNDSNADAISDRNMFDGLDTSSNRNLEREKNSDKENVASVSSDAINNMKHTSGDEACSMFQYVSLSYCSYAAGSDLTETTSFVYYSTKEYYMKIGENPWTLFEESCFEGIKRAMMWSGGSILSATKSKLPDNIRYSIFKTCWKRMKISFDKALESYAQTCGLGYNFEPSKRTWKDLVRHRKITTGMTYCSANQNYFNDLWYLWVHDFNKGFRLFNPLEFNDMFKNNHYLAGNMHEYETTRARLLNLLNVNASHWSREDDGILMGAVDDRDLSYIHRDGSMFCWFNREKTSRKLEKLLEETWRSVKVQYDVMWKNAIRNDPSQFSVNEYVSRSPGELRKHFEILWAKSLYQLDSVQGVNSVVACSIGFTLWNENGQYLSRSLDSLAVKEDDGLRIESTDIEEISSLFHQTSI